jgi:hypothetical protein
MAVTALQTGYTHLDDTPLAAARDWLAGGLACLLVGLLISLAKGGVLRTAWKRLADWNGRLQSEQPAA